MRVESSPIAPPTYLADTNIIVQYVRGSTMEQRIEDQFGLMHSPVKPLISVVSVGEIWSLALQWKWGPARLQRLQNLLTRLIPIQLDFPGIIESYALIDNFCQTKGFALGKNDLWLAATTRATGARLLTTDKDFDSLDPNFLTRDYISPISPQAT